MELTKFRDTSERHRLLKGQIAVYAFATLLSVGLLGTYARFLWQDRHPATPTPGTTATAAATPAPVSVIRPTAQVQEPTPDAGTPPPNNHRHVPAAEIDTGLPTPAPTPVAQVQQSEEEWQRAALARSFAQPTPAARSTPDPVAARYTRWKSLHDGYVQQIRTRLAAATTDEQKGQIQRDIAAWKTANPEPEKPATN